MDSSLFKGARARLCWWLMRSEEVSALGAWGAPLGWNSPRAPGLWGLSHCVGGWLCSPGEQASWGPPSYSLQTFLTLRKGKAQRERDFDWFHVFLFWGQQLDRVRWSLNNLIWGWLEALVTWLVILQAWVSILNYGLSMLCISWAQYVPWKCHAMGLEIKAETDRLPGCFPGPSGGFQWFGGSEASLPWPLFCFPTISNPGSWGRPASLLRVLIISDIMPPAMLKFVALP